MRRPNKPMVPTAPTSLIEYAPDSLRRHIGQPLDSPRQQRATGFEEQSAGHGHRTTSDEQRVTGSEQQRVGHKLRATDKLFDDGLRLRLEEESDQCFIIA